MSKTRTYVQITKALSADAEVTAIQEQEMTAPETTPREDMDVLLASVVELAARVSVLERALEAVIEDIDGIIAAITGVESDAGTLTEDATLPTDV